MTSIQWYLCLMIVGKVYFIMQHVSDIQQEDGDCPPGVPDDVHLPHHPGYLCGLWHIHRLSSHLQILSEVISNEPVMNNIISLLRLTVVGSDIGRMAPHSQHRVWSPVSVLLSVFRRYGWHWDIIKNQNFWCIFYSTQNFLHCSNALNIMFCNCSNKSHFLY